jgi:DNA polymerase-3 subunit gamma/tau
MTDESNTLYLKYRPQTFKEVVGQKEVLKSLVTMGKTKTIPHFLLFTGASGCGKTTIARILKKMLKCGDSDFVEVNASSERGIDMARDLNRQAAMSPISGDCRVWLVDECQAMTGDAQNAMLKILEDIPPKTYFLFATTDPHKLKKTIRTRATELALKPISEKDLVGLIETVAEKEDKEVSDDLAILIAQKSESSARKALVLLHTVINMTDEEAVEHLNSRDMEGEAIAICRALGKKSTTWKQMAEILKSVKEEPEGLRWLIMSYATTTLLNTGNARAAAIIEEFRENWFDSKRSGLVISCYNIINGD